MAQLPTAGEMYGEFLEKIKEHNQVEKTAMKALGMIVFVAGLGLGVILTNAWHTYKAITFHHHNWCVPKSFTTKPALQTSKAKGKSFQ